MSSEIRHVNHELSPMACPVRLADVDLFGTGAQEHWYEAYAILHREAPVLRVRPTQELYLRHRRELTDPWGGGRRDSSPRHDRPVHQRPLSFGTGR